MENTLEVLIVHAKTDTDEVNKMLAMWKYRSELMITYHQASLEQGNWSANFHIYNYVILLGLQFQGHDFFVVLSRPPVFEYETLSRNNYVYPLFRDISPMLRLLEELKPRPNPAEYERYERQNFESESGDGMGMPMGYPIEGTRVSGEEGSENVVKAAPQDWKESRIAPKISPIEYSPPKRDVDCSIYAPTYTSPGQTILVQVFMHLNTETENVENFAKIVDPDALLRNTTVLNKQLAKGSKIGVHLKMPRLLIDDPEQVIIWKESKNSAQFGVAIPSDHPLTSVVGTVYVSYKNVPIGHLKFTLRIVDPASMKDFPDGRVKNISSWQTYKRAFISYASPDRQEVLKRVQMLKIAKIDFFQDLLTLEPGDRWEKELYANIDQSDVFFLFWSSAAKASEYVMKEVDYAYYHSKKELDGHPEIIPIIIEGPPPVEPPEQLRHLHFNDTFIYFINPGEEGKGNGITK